MRKGIYRDIIDLQVEICLQSMEMQNVRETLEGGHLGGSSCSSSCSSFDRGKTKSTPSLKT